MSNSDFMSSMIDEDVIETKPDFMGSMIDIDNSVPTLTPTESVVEDKKYFDINGVLKGNEAIIGSPTGSMEPIIDTFKGLGKQAVGTAELAMNIASGMVLFFPSKIYGLMALPFGREVADMAEESIALLGYQPFTDAGKEATNLVGKGFEWFLAPAKQSGEGTKSLMDKAGIPFSDEAEYLVNFGAELAEFTMTGGIAKGAKARFKPTVKQAKKLFKAKRDIDLGSIIEKSKTLKDIPDEGIKAAQGKILESKAVQAELTYNKNVKKYTEDVMIQDEIGRQKETIAKEKLRPIEDSGLAKPEVKPEVGSDIIKKFKPLEEKVEVVEPIQEVDIASGTPSPVPENIRSPFFQDAKTATEFKSIYEERAKSVNEDPEVFTQKLINDVNQWYHGIGEVPIEQVRSGLSNLAAMSEELRGEFISGSDHAAWKDTVSEASVWASRLEKGIVEEIKPKTSKLTPKEIEEQAIIDSLYDTLNAPKKDKPKTVLRKKDSPKPVQLNMMVPVNGIPKAVKNVLKGTKIKVKDVFRNKELYDKTGFWYGRDKKFRYEYINDISIDRINKLKIHYKGPIDIKALLEKETTSSLKQSRKLEDVYYDKELFQQVPGLKKVRAQYDMDKEFSSFNHSTKVITIGYKEFDIDGSSFTRSFLHELQHAINDSVGAFRGASAKRVGIDAYKKSPGEMEARLIKERHAMSLKQRAAEPPWGTLDRLNVKEGIPGAGVKLYSGVDPIELIKKFKSLVKPNEKVREINLDSFAPEDRKVVQLALDNRKAFKADMEASERGRKVTFKEHKQAIAEALWDTKSFARKALIEGQKSGVFGKEANVVLQRMVNEAGGNGYAQTMFTQFRKEVFGGLDKNKIRILNQLIKGRRVQDIANYKEGAKFPKGQGAAESIAYDYLFEGIEGLGGGEAVNLKSRVNAYFEWMNRLIDVRESEGIIDPIMAKGLKEHDYAKFKGIGQRLSDGKGGSVETLYDQKYKASVGGKIVSVNSSGIDSLPKGKQTDILEASQDIVALEVFNRTYGQAFTNRTFTAMVDMAKANPTNPYVRLMKKNASKEQPPLTDSRGWIKHHYFEKGVKNSMYIEPNFANGLGIAGRDLSPRAIELSKLTSLSTVAKIGHTGIAPLWSTFVNLPLDTIHALTSSGIYEGGEFKPVYSPVVPLGALQIGRDFSSTFYDVFFRAHNQPERTKFMRTAERGLLMPFLSTQGRLSKKGYQLPGKLSKLEDFMTYYPNSLELWTRHSIAERVIRNEAKKRGIGLEEARANNEIMDQAVFAARDYLDFNQGGWFTKMKDQMGWIYLNAATQVLRTEGRSLKGAPKSYIAKNAQMIAAPTVMVTVAAMLNSPITNRSVPSYMDENNLILPFPDSFIFKDNTGQEFGMVMTMPLGSGTSFIKNVTQALTKKLMFESGLSDEEPNYKAIVGSLTKMAPDLMTLPPAQRALVEYALNMNFWTRRQTVPQSFKWPKSAEEGKVGDTPEIALDVGKVTGLSPERLDLVRKNIIGNNIWTYALGAGYDKSFGDVPKEMREEHIALTLSKIPGISRWIKVVKIGGDRFEKQEEYKEEDRFNRFVDSKNVDYYTKLGYWYSAEDGKNELRKYMKEPRIRKDPDTYDRLYERSVFLRNIKDLPERSTWSSMWYESASVKAQDYLDRKRAAKTDADKAKLRKQISIIYNTGGYAGDKFWEEVSRLKRDVGR